MEGVPLGDILRIANGLNVPLRLANELALDDADAGADDITGDNEPVTHALSVGAADDAAALPLSVADGAALSDGDKLGLLLVACDTLSDADADALGEGIADIVDDKAGEQEARVKTKECSYDENCNAVPDRREHSDSSWYALS